MTRELRWIGSASTDMKNKSAWEVYTGGAWVNLNTDGGALPGEVSNGNDNITFDSNAVAAPTANGAPETFSSVWNIEADYGFVNWHVVAPVKASLINVRKTNCNAPANGNLTIPSVVNQYAAMVWSLSGWGAATFNLYHAGALPAQIQLGGSCTINSYVSGVTHNVMGNLIKCLTDPPAAADVRKGVAFENGLKTGTLVVPRRLVGF